MQRLRRKGRRKTKKQQSRIETGNKSAFLGDDDPYPIMLMPVPKKTRKKERKRKSNNGNKTQERDAESEDRWRFSIMNREDESSLSDKTGRILSF